jgi:hypothetical protein
MTSPRLRATIAAACLGLAVPALTACTGPQHLPLAKPTAPATPKVAPAGPYQLVAFDSCGELLGGLRAAAKATVGPWGFGIDGRFASAMDGSMRDLASAKAPLPEGAASHSGTNNHEAGVEEPDQVKTDGKRIVTVSGGFLRVTDPATRRVTGKLDLAEAADKDHELARWTPASLLLAGDRALVITSGLEVGATPTDAKSLKPSWGSVRVLLVDLAGTPRLLSTYRMDGAVLDARQVGATARVVIRAQPRITFPYQQSGTDKQRTAANRKIIDRTPVEDWLPRYEVTTGTSTEKGHVECDEVRRPTAYSAQQTLTVASFDLAADSLGRGDPVTLVADGQTVYGTATSLYVASDERWRALPWALDKAPKQVKTEVYQFDTAGDVPVFSGGGAVPGYLLSQYAMSEFDGVLRLATTTGEPWNSQGRAESGVYALRLADGQLNQIGHVGGLGKGERIYGVRFAGPIGYVVTFRQTDPLYTVDLSDPTHPSIKGELKVDGYSAYLHPLDNGRLLGVGQDVRDGRTRGTQVAVFDVTDLAAPRRVDRLTVPGSYSDAEYDPHAFLYWPADGTVVLPLYSWALDDGELHASAAVLRVAGGDVRQVGELAHPVRGNDAWRARITRSLVIDRTLWTVSDAGLMANDLSTLSRTAWLPF